MVTCIKNELAQAKAFASLGRGHVERQRQIVETCERDGINAAGAKVLLSTLEQTQALHEAAVQRLQDELAAFESGDGIAAQSQRELRRRLEENKTTKALLSSAQAAMQDSKSLLDELQEKP